MASEDAVVVEIERRVLGVGCADGGSVARKACARAEDGLVQGGSKGTAGGERCEHSEPSEGRGDGGGGWMHGERRLLMGGGMGEATDI